VSHEKRPQRFLVAGVSGVGKTTLAREIARVTGIAHTEIDALYHGPNWTPRERFLDDVRHLAAGSSWVTEWQYRDARPILLARADLLIWLDFPRRISLGRVIRRTWRRSRSHEVLWNGNREPGMAHALFAKEGVIRWAIRTHNRYPRLIAEARHEWPAVAVVRLTSQSEAQSLLEALETTSEG